LLHRSRLAEDALARRHQARELREHVLRAEGLCDRAENPEVESAPQPLGPAQNACIMTPHKRHRVRIALGSKKSQLRGAICAAEIEVEQYEIGQGSALLRWNAAASVMAVAAKSALFAKRQTT
jgi:hypothetical protein